MKKALIDQYSKEELEQIVKESHTYREVIIKLGYSSVTGGNNETLKERLKLYQISTSHFNSHYYKRQRKLNIEKIFSNNSTVSQQVLRSAIQHYNIFPYQCRCCGNTGVWQDKPLTLTLDHINGNNHDNRIENLRWLCPNCDRQQPTFGSKNKKELHKGKILIPLDSCTPAITKKSQTEVPPRELIKEKLFDYKNYTQCANYFGVSPTQLRRWCKHYKLPTTISIVKHTTEIGWEKENWNDGYEPPKPKTMNNKPCAMIDPNTDEIIKTFNSRSEAARYVSDSYNAQAHIMAVCKGKRKTAYGYKWKDIDAT